MAVVSARPCIRWSATVTARNLTRSTRNVAGRAQPQISFLFRFEAPEKKRSNWYAQPFSLFLFGGPPIEVTLEQTARHRSALSSISLRSVASPAFLSLNPFTNLSPICFSRVEFANAATSLLLATSLCFAIFVSELQVRNVRAQCELGRTPWFDLMSHLR